jgi:LPS sulfotransferase NodH
VARTGQPYAAYVICTAPRSGSTLHCKLLAATGVAGSPGSYFHEPDLSKWCAYHGVTAGADRSERAILREVVDAALRKGRGETPIFGLRMQRRSFPFFEEKLAVLFPDLADTPGRITAAFGQTLFIRLRRADVIDQALSFVKAQQTGLWHRSSDGSELERLSPPAPPIYDFEAIDVARREFEGFNADWDGWFERYGIAPLEIAYSDLAAAPGAVLERVLERFGQDADLAGDIEPPVARLSDGTNAEWKARYAADRSARSGCPR